MGGQGREVGAPGRSVQETVFVDGVFGKEGAAELAREATDAGALVQAGGEIDADANGVYFRWVTK